MVWSVVRQLGLALALLFVLAGVRPVMADTIKSNNYRFEESTIGGGGLVQSGSANYSITEALSDAAAGLSGSANYGLIAGSKAPDDPALSFSVSGGNASFGNLSPSSAATATASFAVLNYTSYGYVVQLIGTPPTNSNGRALAALPTATASQAGVEQFGLNMVANTAPVSLGANPNQGQFGFGVAAPNYATANKYRFVNGETIASAPKSSGVTSYTISYIANVTSLTPGGQYTASQTVVCTGTY